MNAPTYDADFYATRRAQTAHAAETVLSIIAPFVKMDSVADIGCGTGTWLASALASGATSALGIEGDWVKTSMLDDRRIDLHNQSLEDRVSGVSVDLVISLEVAEHLSENRADSFVEDLTKTGPTILFSAAIPGQGGVGHLNEKWQSYWAEKFVMRGYQAIDIVRPAIWNNPKIPMWYKQNIILYISSDTPNHTGLEPTRDVKNLDIVHPLFWERANRELRHANARPESEYLNLD